MIQCIHQYSYKDKRAMEALYGLQWNRNIRTYVKNTVFHSTVENIALYRAETGRVRDKVKTVALEYMR